MELGTESRCVAEGRLCDPLNWMVKVASQPLGVRERTGRGVEGASGDGWGKAKAE